MKVYVLFKIAFDYGLDGIEPPPYYDLISIHENTPIVITDGIVLDKTRKELDEEWNFEEYLDGTFFIIEELEVQK